MRTLKLAGAILVALAVMASLAATALAAETLRPCLPCATGATFTEKNKKVTLQVKGGSAVTCAEGSAEGEVVAEQTLKLKVVHWGKSCTSGGLPVDSLGDASGLILSHVELHICLSGSKLMWLQKLLPLHLEVPSTKLLMTVEGAFISEITPINTSAKTFSLAIEQKEGKQAIEKCEGGTAQTLLTSSDGGAFVQTGIEVKEDSATFAAEQEFMALPWPAYRVFPAFPCLFTE